MRYHEFSLVVETKTIKPMSPDEARLDALKKSKDAAVNAEKMERERQKQKRAIDAKKGAQQSIQQIGKI